MHLALQSARPRLRAVDPYAAFDPLAAAADLASSLTSSFASSAESRFATGAPGGAVRRQRLGGAALRDGDWLRASGLLALSVPREHGGGGACWQTVLDTVRIVARADAALARLLGLHHLQLATIELYASAHRRHRLLASSSAEELFWGDAVDPLDRGVVATPVAGGYVLNGTRQLACAAVEADWLTVSAWDPLARASLVAVLPTAQPGVAMDSGGDAVRFDGVLLPEENVLQPAAQRAAMQSTLRAQVAALVAANVTVGTAEGGYGRFPGGDADAAGRALADAATRIDFAFACGGALDAAERDALAAAVDRAAVLARDGADTAGPPAGVPAAAPAHS